MARARTGSADDAGVHVLEAVIVACVMVSGVAFVVTFEVPPSETADARAGLQQRVRDVLAILNDTPVANSTLGDNVLSVGLLECLQQSCDRLATTLDRLLPVGTKFSVYLSTGEGLHPIYAPREPAGEAVSARRLIEPAWSYLFLATAQNVHNPLQDPLVVYGVPIVSGSPVHQGGSALSIVAHGKRDSDNAAFVLKTSATTRAVASGDEPSAAGVSLFFHDGDGVARGTRDVRGQTLDVAGVPTNAPVRFGLRVQESGGGMVPAGTIVSVQVPHGWSASAPQEANDPRWLVLSNASDTNGSARGSVLSAKLLAPASASSVDLLFDATYAGDADDHYAFSASLTAGAYARASLLVRADRHAALSPFEMPTFVASVPRPLGAGAVTTWTLAASAPEGIRIERIEIKEEQGRPIFAGASGLSGGGSWTSEGHKLAWTGEAAVGRDSSLDLTFEVTSVAMRGPLRERAPFVPSVDFGEYSGALAQESAPGLHRGVFLPASSSMKGYDPVMTGLSTGHPLASDSVYRTTALPGRIQYAVGPAIGLSSSVLGSAVSVDRRHVTHGDAVGLDVEVQSLLYHLALLGLDPTVEINVYPPWTGDARKPLHHKTLYNGTLAKGEGTFLSLVDTTGDLVPDETQVGRLAAEVQVEPQWLYGAYIVEARVAWVETVGTLPHVEDIMRTAHVYDYFVVTPSTGELPASPVYDVHLVAWQEDWG